MKMIIAAVVLFTILQSQGCEKETPACITARIEAIRKEPKWNPPATVYRYKYEGQYVYLFSAPCCDQYNYLYDGNCNVICAPSGGLTGKGDGKCPGFLEGATDEVLIWKDER